MTESPSLPRLPEFEHVRQGYHPGQVDEFIRMAGQRLRDLEQQLAGALHGSRSEPARLIADLVRDGLAELDSHRAGLDADLAAARARVAADAEQLLDSAHADAQQILAAAQSQADQLLAQARSDARAMIEDATARQAAASARAQEMADLHGSTLHRLAAIRDQLHTALAGESQMEQPLVPGS
jgi:cell division septum initiation protein DivIVA